MMQEEQTLNLLFHSLRPSPAIASVKSTIERFALALLVKG